MEEIADTWYSLILIWNDFNQVAVPLARWPRPQYRRGFTDVHEKHQQPEGDEEVGDEHEVAEHFRYGQQHHGGVLEHVHQLVERVLHAGHNAAFRHVHVLQEQLRDGQVRHP